eukprot:scaffold41218_cov221-Amphora_coffeaeformis.AAC.1
MSYKGKGSESSSYKGGYEEQGTCSAHPKCAHLHGNCCPTNSGIYLYCCENYPWSKGKGAYSKGKGTPDVAPAPAPEPSKGRQRQLAMAS